MTTPVTEPDLSLDPWEEGISDEESRRRQPARNQSLIALIDSWIAEGENATDEERRAAEEEWDEFLRGIEPVRFREWTIDE